MLGRDGDDLHRPAQSAVLDAKAEKLGLAHGGLHRGARLLLADSKGAGFLELVGKALDGDLDLFGDLRLRLGDCLRNVRFRQVLRTDTTSRLLAISRAYRCLGSVEVNEVFRDEALLPVGQRHVWLPLLALGGHWRGTMPKITIKLLPILLLPLAIAGCVSAEDQRTADQEKCASYGYQPGTEGFANCMMSQDFNRDDDQRRTMESLERQDRRDRRRVEKLESTAGVSSSTGVIDDRPQYDKDGNPNFDTQGNYIGCHGIGCEVDNPDDDTDD